MVSGTRRPAAHLRFGREGPPDIYVKDLSGPLTEKLVFGLPDLQVAFGSGRATAVHREPWVPYRAGKAQRQIVTLPRIGGQTRAPVGNPFSESTCPRFSGSRFVAFVSESPGRPRCYVAAIDGTGRKAAVSRPPAGRFPCWSADGKELLSSSDNVMAVDVRLGQHIQLSAPKPLFSLPAFPAVAH